MDVHTRIAALEAQQRDLTAHIAALRAEVDEVESRRTRRDLFRTVGAAAAGAVTGGLLLSGARPAAAADTSPLTLGSGANANNTSSTPTTLSYTNGPIAQNNVLTVQSSTSSAVAPSAYPAAVAGWAQTSGGPANGAYGFTGQNNGYGVVAFGNNATSGLAGAPATGLLARGGVANMELLPGGDPPGLRTDAHKVGELVVDALDTLWYCTVAGTPGTWRKVSGPGTAGQLHMFGTPFRITDTRIGTGPAATGQGPVPSGSERGVFLGSGFQGPLAAPAMPGTATAALMTLTLADTVGSGFLAVIADGTTYAGTSNVNWSTAGQFIANTVIAPVRNARVAVHAGGAGTTNFIIDLVGYFA